MKILALDRGKLNTMCCLFDSKTRNYSFLIATTDRIYLATIFKKHKVDLVVMEACGPSGWINDLAMSFGLKTIVCSTNEDAWRWSNVKRKTCKDDARKLAQMAASNELVAVNMPSPEHREFRSILKNLKALDSCVNKIKCSIRTWVVNQGIEIDSGNRDWHTGRQLLDSYRKPLVECSLNELWRELWAFLSGQRLEWLGKSANHPVHSTNDTVNRFFVATRKCDGPCRLLNA